MRLLNRRLSGLLLSFVFLLLPGAAQDSGPPRSTPPPQQQQQQPPAGNAGQPQNQPQTAPQGQSQNPPQGQPQGQNPSVFPDATQQPPAQQQPEPNDSGVFVFKKEVEEVVLHATVVDDKQHLVTNLPKDAFKVYENGKLQPVTSFRHEDIPVALGIVIDNSGSMREKRPEVNRAALNLVRASNPQDQVFVVNFSEEYFLDQDFTSNINKLKAALEKVESRGGTALYDAVVASADNLKNSKLQKKVLFVVTDGEDNASRETLEEAVKRLQQENGPTIYSIGILGEEKQRRARRALQTLSESTGGIAFLPKSLGEVDEISSTVAHDIRNQYTIGYKPTTPKSAGGYRTIKVEAKWKGFGRLDVRTRSGYYPGQEQSAGGSF